MRHDSTLKSVLKSFGIDTTKFADHKKALLADKGLMGSIANEKNRTDRVSKTVLRDNNLLCFAVKDNYVVNDKTLQAFKKMFDIKNDDKTATSALKKSASAILNGVVDARLMPQTATRFYNIVNFGFEKIYEDLAVYAKHGATLDDMMNYTARSAFEICYTSLNRYDITREKQVELAQKLANLVINNYSPVSFTNEVANEKYADFVTKDSALLTSIVEKLEPERIGTKEFIKKQAEAAKKKAANKAENDRKEAEARQRLEKEAEAKREAEREAQLEVKRSYKREIANPIAMPQKIEQPFIRACRQELNQSFNDSRLTEAFKLQVVKVLNDFGVENVAATNAANAIFAKVSDKDEGMYKIYKALESYVEWPQDPSSVVDEMIGKATEKFRKLVTDCFEDPAIGIIASRNVMDVILKNYSPAAFAKGDTLRNQVNSYLFDSNSINGNAYFHKYFNSNYKKDFPEGKIPSHNGRSDFIKWIKDANEKLEREAEAKRVAAARRERKPVEKYERKVEGVKLAMSDYSLIATDANFNVFMEECKKSIADPNLT
jgi:hypothetical protein